MKQKIIAFLKGEAFAYIFFGVCTTAVNFICFTLFYKYLKLGLNFSNFSGIVISILFAFFTNKYYVFKSRKACFKVFVSELLKFVSGRIFTMLAEIVGVWLLVELISFNEYLSKLILQIVVIIGNYFISKFLVFKNNS